VRAETRFAIGALLDGSSGWIKADDIIAAGPPRGQTKATGPNKKSNWKLHLTGNMWHPAAVFSKTGFHAEDLPMPSFRLLAPALFALALCGAPPAASAQSFTDTQRGDIETIVKNYLISHPEVLEEAMAELSKRQAAAETEKHEASIAKNSETIFNSPRGVSLGNKDGDVTFVEFFDYNCGYCKRAMADMLDLMKTDPKLKVVLKEFPVLGPGSVEAAQVAVAARMQDPGGKKYLDFHQKLLGGRGQADKAHAMAAAKDAGYDMARLEKDLGSPEVRATIEENFKLAEDMGMNGTPSYVIGKQVVVGAVGLDGLKEKIGMARCGKATC
jgi:protein-disulfide isomerase